jgi:hypothetical protein
MPLWSDAPGGRLTVVILDVEEMNLGSEISDLFIDRFRAPGKLPWEACELLDPD